MTLPPHSLSQPQALTRVDLSLCATFASLAAELCKPSRDRLSRKTKRKDGQLGVAVESVDNKLRARRSMSALEAFGKRLPDESDCGRHILEHQVVRDAEDAEAKPGRSCPEKPGVAAKASMC